MNKAVETLVDERLEGLFDFLVEKLISVLIRVHVTCHSLLNLSNSKLVGAGWNLRLCRSLLYSKEVLHSRSAQNLQNKFIG